MRRKDREITQPEQIYEIIKKCDVCRIAFFDKDFPYIVPVNFGATFENGVFILYFHGADAGKKMALLQQNNAVAFEMDCKHTLIEGQKGCDYTMKYQSVCGTGHLQKLTEEQKVQALSSIMKQYTDKEVSFQPERVKATAVLKLTVEQITAKSNI